MSDEKPRSAKPDPRHVMVCPQCGTTLAVDAEGKAQRAVAADVEVVPPVEVKELRRARATVVRPKAKR